MATQLDRSSHDVVIHCTECPGWADIVLSDERAHDLAVEHEARVHPGVSDARDRRDVWRVRRARHAAR